MGATHILDLPPEVLQKIFNFLSLSDLFTTRIVCRSFRDAASAQQVLELDLGHRRIPIREFDQLELLDPLRRNITSLNFFCTPGVVDEEANVDTYITTEQFLKIRNGSNRLKRLKLFNYAIRDVDTFPNIVPNTLTHLSLDCVTFDDSDRFFDVQGCRQFRKMTELELMRSGQLRSAVFDGIAQFVNLSTLRLTEVLVTDEEFARLDGHLSNLEELRVVGIDIGDESFQVIGRNFVNLKRLTVTRCRVRDSGFAAIKNNHQLEELHVKGCRVTDHGVSRVLGYLVNLRDVWFCECPIGDQTMRTLFLSRTNLRRLRITLDGETNITDAALEDVSVHEHLTDLYLQGVGIADEGIRRLAPCIPNLEKMCICSCNVGDEGMAAIARHVPKLTQLILNNTLVTDEGLIPIGQHLTELIHFEVDSIEMSERGVQPLVDYLSSLKFVNVSFGTSGAGIHINGTPPSRQVDIKGKDVSVDFVQDVLRAFHSSFTISLSQVELSPSIVENLSKSHKDLTSIFIYDSYTDDITTSAILRCFSDLNELHVYNSLVTDDLLIEIAEKYKGRLEKLSIENEQFVQGVTIARIVPLIASLRWCEICSVDYNRRLIFDNSSGDVKLNVAGNEITDDGIVALVSAVPTLKTMSITSTNVTCEGLERIISKLTSLYRFEIVCHEDETKMRGNDVLKLIGSDLPSKLQELKINGGGVTDDGLLSLGDQLSNLHLLLLMNSAVTNDGLKTIASKLTSCTSLTTTVNPFITEDITDYMALNHPQIMFVLAAQGLDLEDDEP